MSSVADRMLRRQQVGDQISRLAWLLDEAFRIPGLNWRFGIDALIGLIPGAGDLVTTALAVLLLLRAFQFRLPGIVKVRMVLNTLIDLVIGSIPVVGDAFDFAWKSNSMNMRLFQKYAEEPQRSTWGHWVFIGSIILLFAAVFVLISLVTFLLLRKLLG